MWIFTKAREIFRQDTEFFRKSAADVARIANSAHQDIRKGGLRLFWEALRGKLVLSEAGERGVQRLFHLFGLSAAALGLYTGIMGTMGYALVAYSTAWLALIFMTGTGMCALLLRRQST